MPEYRNIPTNAACYSDVAKPEERTLCVTVPEMVQCGVSENVLYKGCRRQQLEETNCWPHHKEGNTIYLHYSGLKANYQAMIRKVLMDDLSVEEWYNRNGRVQAIRERLVPYAYLTADDETALDAATYPTGERLSPEAREKAAEACRWLSLFTRLSSKQAIKGIGYATVGELYDDVTFLIARQGISLPTAYVKLRKKIREYEAEGAICCVDRRGQSNKNAAKVYTEDQTALLRTICGRSASYNAQQIANFYNLVAEAKGWDTISRRSALNYLNEYHLIVEAGRNGSEAFRNKISMQPRRKRPTEALSFWSLDGWTVELYYQKDVKGPDGKITHTYTNRLTAVVVLDATCDYPVGYAIGEGESVKLIAEAVKNAIDYVHDTLGGPYRPYQIQSDHYGIKSMGTVYNDVAKYFTPARVKNAKSKPIERYFRYLNENYCQLYFGNSNWSGFGVKTRGKKQPNIDVLELRKRNFPYKEGVIQQIHWIFQQEREKKQKTWMEAWLRMPESDRLTLSRENYLLNFGMRNDRTIRIQAGCLAPTILGKQRAYDTFDLNFRKNPMQSWTVMYDERDLSTILVTNETKKERYLLNAVHEQPMALRDREDGDFEALKAIDNFNKNVLEPSVIETVNRDEETVKNLLLQTPELEGWRTVNMLTDSRGQQKAYLQHSTLIKSEEDLVAEMEDKIRLNAVKTARKHKQDEEKRAKKAAEAAYEDYALSKIDLSKFQ